jgi:hypothetical protein
VVDGTEGSALGGRKGLRLEEGRVQVPGKRLWRTGAGRAGGSGRTSRPFKWGPRTPSGILSSTQTARRLRTVLYPPTDAPFLSLLHFPVALPMGEAGRSLGSARGARGWQPAGGAIGSPTLTPRSGLGANLRIRWISRFQFSVFSWSSSGSSSQLFTVSCLVSGSHRSSLSSLKYITAVYKPPAGGKH